MTAPRKHDLHARRDRLLREHIHDPYKMRSKLPEPTVCTACGAVYREGRWMWSDAPADAHEHTCPACLRTQDDYPAGIVHLAGRFPRAHWPEILALVRNVEAREKAEHALERIMSVESAGDATVVRTTGMHLARAIGSALFDAFEGDLDFDYPEETALLRVRWTR